MSASECVLSAGDFICLFYLFILFFRLEPLNFWWQERTYPAFTGGGKPFGTAHATV